MANQKLTEIEMKSEEEKIKRDGKIEELRRMKQMIIAQEIAEEKKQRALMLVDKGAVLELFGFLELPNSVIIGLMNEFKCTLSNRHCDKFREWDVVGGKMLDERLRELRLLTRVKSKY